MPEPRNRKERRAAAKVKTAEDIPLNQPNREARGTKTLLDIAAEHRPDLNDDAAEGRPSGTQPELIHTKVNPDGTLTIDEQNVDQYDLWEAFGNAILFGVSLAMIHLTLDVLVHNQYAERFEWREMINRAGLALTIMSTLVFIMHPRAEQVWAQAAFLVGSIAAGCYLVYVSSTYTYLAVMRQAPPLGVLWIYSVFEQRAELAVVGVVAVVGYFWWGGYTLLS